MIAPGVRPFDFGGSAAIARCANCEACTMRTWEKDPSSRKGIG
jgi:hypothetical protein